MTNPNITIYDASTNETIEREMTSDELAQWEKDKAKRIEELAAEQSKQIEKNALLSKLGITPDEAKLLLS